MVGQKGKSGGKRQGAGRKETGQATYCKKLKTSDTCTSTQSIQKFFSRRSDHALNKSPETSSIPVTGNLCEDSYSDFEKESEIAELHNEPSLGALSENETSEDETEETAEDRNIEQDPQPTCTLSFAELEKLPMKDWMMYR